MHKKCRSWSEVREIEEYTWYNQSLIPLELELCYKPHHHHDVDYIYFDEQLRNLGKDGGQGPIDIETEELCEDLCQIHRGTGTLKEYVLS